MPQIYLSVLRDHDAEKKTRVFAKMKISSKALRQDRVDIPHRMRLRYLEVLIQDSVDPVKIDSSFL